MPGSSSLVRVLADADVNAALLAEVKADMANAVGRVECPDCGDVTVVPENPTWIEYRAYLGWIAHHERCDYINTLLDRLRAYFAAAQQAKQELAQFKCELRAVHP